MTARDAAGARTGGTPRVTAGRVLLPLGAAVLGALLIVAVASAAAAVAAVVASGLLAAAYAAVVAAAHPVRVGRATATAAVLVAATAATAVAVFVAARGAGSATTALVAVGVTAVAAGAVTEADGTAFRRFLVALGALGGYAVAVLLVEGAVRWIAGGGVAELSSGLGAGGAVGAVILVTALGAAAALHLVAALPPQLVPGEEARRWRAARERGAAWWRAPSPATVVAVGVTASGVVAWLDQIVGAPRLPAVVTWSVLLPATVAALALTTGAAALTVWRWGTHGRAVVRGAMVLTPAVALTNLVPLDVLVAAIAQADPVAALALRESVEPAGLSPAIWTAVLVGAVVAVAVVVTVLVLGGLATTGTRSQGLAAGSVALFAAALTAVAEGGPAVVAPVGVGVALVIWRLARREVGTGAAGAGGGRRPWATAGIAAAVIAAGAVTLALLAAAVPAALTLEGTRTHLLAGLSLSVAGVAALLLTVE